MPTLIIEDGSEVANANTYISLTEYETFIAGRGLTDSRDDTAKEAAIISAKDYVENQHDRFSGTKRNRDNSLVWPRYNAYAFGYVIDSDEIPVNLKNAQAQVAYDSANSAIYSVGSGKAVIRRKTDVLETEYSTASSAAPQNVFVAAEEFLKPLYKNSGAFGVVRV